MSIQDPISESDDHEVPGTQALMRAIDVLMAISLAPHPPRFGELHAALDIPKGTLHRLLAALIRRRLIRLEEHTRRYFTGSRIFDLARRTLDQSQLTRAVKPEMVRIARELGRPTCLYLADGADVFVIDFEDPDAAQTRMVRVWPRERAGDTAAGLTIAAHLPRPGNDGGVPDGIDHSLGRALGYAIHRDAMGRASVAAAICDEREHPVAALSVVFDAGPVNAERLHEAGLLVSVAARRAAGNMGLGQNADACRPAPEKAADSALRCLDTGRDFMGENPVWSPHDNRLWWLDILAPALRSLDLTTGATTRQVLPDITGGLALDGRGRMILLGQSGIGTWDPETGVRKLLLSPEADRPGNRFNTAAIAPDGTLWAGTMSVRNRPGPGTLYRITPDLTVTRMIDRIGLPKNCAWSPDGRRMYVSEGEGGTLLAFDLDDAGRPGAGRLLLQGSAQTGFPNGICCDAQGAIWVAMLGGWRLLRLAPDGRILRTVHLPIPMPTAVAFGGADLRRLFITSTYLRLPPGFSTLAPQSGNLFSLSVDVAGQPPRLFGQPA